MKKMFKKKVFIKMYMLLKANKFEIKDLMILNYPNFTRYYLSVSKDLQTKQSIKTSKE